MSERSIQLRLGVAAIAAAVFLYFYAIPAWVASPGQVPVAVMSPLFWPNVLAGMTGIIGLALVAKSRNSTAEALKQDAENRRPALLRLAAMAIVMVAVMYLIPRLGMVWTCMIAFAISAFIMNTRHRGAALISAVIIPLVLYFFFAHIAGVAVPQGNFVWLP
ncbi:tripartite tricarboxylate transporter TctB family protein [Roseibium sp. SCP14]|uniref:tripartite tricarboxylate transporter TctB family protein n=1 Tax=Roseibium sp. SCP14 TaxID=3141375 RepID=UPI00333DD51D